MRRIRNRFRAAAGAAWLAGAMVLAAMVLAAMVLAGCVTDQSATTSTADGAPQAAAPALNEAAAVASDPAAQPPQQGAAVASDPPHWPLGAFSPHTQEGVPPITTETIQQNANVQYYRSDEPLRLGIEHFNRGDFGIAEHYFQDAVASAPKDASAWIALAASYDRLGRFDLADRAYQAAIHLVGETTAILNNLGYSYMLRGNPVAARRYFLEAYAREPHNPTIINNLHLLDESERFISRAPDAL
ncbi:MAG: tetratricopeptide repeat protein [Pseudomonadota bacterium]